jgi:hypothetical protein
MCSDFIVHLQKEHEKKVVIVSRLKNTGVRGREGMIYIPGKFHVKYWYVGEWLRDLDPF